MGSATHHTLHRRHMRDSYGTFMTYHMQPPHNFQGNHIRDSCRACRATPSLCIKLLMLRRLHRMKC